MHNKRNQPPGYSDAMEFLCSLPVLPSTVSLSALQKDFGTKTQNPARVFDIIKQLRDKGVNILLFYYTTGHTRVGIGKTTGKRATRMCEWYWKRMGY